MDQFRSRKALAIILFVHCDVIMSYNIFLDEIFNADYFGCQEQLIVQSLDR